MASRFGHLCSMLLVIAVKASDAVDYKWSTVCVGEGASTDWAAKIIHSQNAGVTFVQMADGWPANDPSTWTWQNFSHSQGLNIKCLVEGPPATEWGADVVGGPLTVNASSLFISAIQIPCPAHIAAYGDLFFGGTSAIIKTPLNPGGLLGVWSDEMYWVSNDHLVEEFRSGHIDDGEDKEDAQVIWGYALFGYTDVAAAKALATDYHTGYQIIEDVFCLGSYTWCRTEAEAHFRLKLGDATFQLGKEHYTQYAMKTCTCDSSEKCMPVALTCGDIKNAYKSQGCCGNPTATFSFPSSRRLNLLDDEGQQGLDKESQGLLDQLKSAMLRGGADAMKVKKAIKEALEM